MIAVHEWINTQRSAQKQMPGCAMVQCVTAILLGQGAQPN
jgi:hypothetical protein